MKTFRINKSIFQSTVVGFAAILLPVAMLLSGCKVKEPNFPNQGNVTLYVDWLNIGKGIAVPQNYTVQVGDYSAVLSGTTNTLNNFFMPGRYFACIFNNADGIDINAATATVALTGGMAVPMPGWFFTAAQDLYVEKDKKHQYTIVMQQQVRELNLLIEPTGGSSGRIERIEASMNGVASMLDFVKDIYSGPVNVAPEFVKQADGKWKATVRLLGIIGEEQILNLTLFFDGNSPQSVTHVINIHQALTFFNNNKTNPLTLHAYVVETPTDEGFTATITGWTEFTEEIDLK